MKKPNQKQLIEILANQLLKVTKQVEDLESRFDIIDKIFSEDTDMDLQVSEDELVRFTAEFYKEICKHCGTKGLDFMGIA